MKAWLYDWGGANVALFHALNDIFSGWLPLRRLDVPFAYPEIELFILRRKLAWPSRLIRERHRFFESRVIAQNRKVCVCLQLFGTEEAGGY